MINPNSGMFSRISKKIYIIALKYSNVNASDVDDSDPELLIVI